MHAFELGINQHDVSSDQEAVGKSIEDTDQQAVGTRYLECQAYVAIANATSFSLSFS